METTGRSGGNISVNTCFGERKWQYLAKLKMCVPYCDPEVYLLDLYHGEILAQVGRHKQDFTVI